MFGLLGPNGAGKSTTLKMLATLLRPSGGTARIAGHDLVTEANEVRKIIIPASLVARRRAAAAADGLELVATVG